MMLMTMAAVMVAAATMPVTSAQSPDPSDVIDAVVRQVCDRQWVDGVCEPFGYADPQYATGTDPTPDGTLAWRTGAVHEHSGYSDGDPDTRPADYFAAGASGENTADDGAGNTGVRLDYMLSAEHSDNEKLPVTTAAACIDPAAIPDALAAGDLLDLGPLLCANIDRPDHFRKWAETLAQAITATDFDAATGSYDGFTALRGFEWTNDYYNHLGVYFSRNTTNAKIDGSYLGMEFFWDWLAEPVDEGGGADALVVFNHPGKLPALSPFDGDLPHNQILADTLGGENWNDLAYVASADPNVVGIEVNGGDGFAWYLRALENGWHLGPVAAEDEHQREWASTEDGKTLVLTRGRSPRDYYFALAQHRVVAVAADWVSGAPGSPAVTPVVDFWAGGESMDDPAATLLGSTVGGPTTLRADVRQAPARARVVLVSPAGPAPLGQVADDGTFSWHGDVAEPEPGVETWHLIVVCGEAATDCGQADSETSRMVTAPIWTTAAADSGATVTDATGAPAPAPSAVPASNPMPSAVVAPTLPATGPNRGFGPLGPLGVGEACALGIAAISVSRVARRTRRRADRSARITHG